MTHGLSQDPLERYQQFRNDPWLFLKHCCFTHDEVDQQNPIKLYPSHLLYLKLLVELYKKTKKLAVPKSRRLTVSWTFIGLAVHDCIFFKGRSHALVSKKEEDSKELVQRAFFIYSHIPGDMISPDLLPKLKRGEMQSSPPVMEFPDIHSKIMGFPSGANQMRQRGFSSLFFDEVAFWEEAEGAFASAEPTVKGGGRIVMVSTRYPGFFKKVVYDRFDAQDLNFVEMPPAGVQVHRPIEGVEVWTNPSNGFTVADISHRANPLKRSPEFEAELRKSLPVHLFNMEYGKSWSNFTGKPVYQDFDALLHILRTKPQAHVGLPLLLGWDSSGLTPACVIGQVQGDQLVIMREIVGSGMGAIRFVPKVIEEIRQHFPQIKDIETQVISFFDPAGFKKNEISEQTYVQTMMAGGFKQVRPGPMTWNKRVDAVTSYLIGLAKGKPIFQVYEADCPILVNGFRNGFRYPDKTADIEPDKIRPIKDIHSHPHDGLQYLCGGLRAYTNEHYNITIPEPKYGFQKASLG